MGWRPPGQPDQLTTRTAYVSIDDVDMPVEAVPTALRYARERIDDAIKVVVKIGHPEGC